MSETKKNREFFISPANLRNAEVVCETEEHANNFPDQIFIHVVEYQALLEEKQKVHALTRALQTAQQKICFNTDWSCLRNEEEGFVSHGPVCEDLKFIIKKYGDL